VQLYTGMRTSACKKLLPDQICSNVQPITINKESFVSVVLDKFLLPDAAVEQLAIADGFKDSEEFVNFFKQTHGLPFEGVLISWMC
jgi:hypothetical protein